MGIDDQVAIRHATEEDIPDILRLARSSESAAQWSEQQYRALILGGESATSTLALVAGSSENSPILGFLIARHVDREWELENIVVSTEVRRNGIGKHLCERLLGEAQQRNGEVVFLEVRESNIAARALYKKLGFRETGRRKSYYNNPLEDAVVCCKTLPSSVPK